MRDRLDDMLGKLERELRLQGRWSNEAPSEEALQSQQPFAVDTLTFDEWLQWILVPRLRSLLLQQLPLPGNCAIQPMAEEVYAGEAEPGDRLIAIIAEIDALLTDKQGGMN